MNEDEIRAKHKKEEALAQKNQAKAVKNQVKQEKSAEENLAVHFQNNDLEDAAFAQESESSSSSDE